MKLSRAFVPLCLILLFIPFSKAADLEWTNATQNSDFYDEGNWIITSGSINTSIVGDIPPAGTIDPMAVGTDPIAHNLFVMDGMADMSLGDLALDMEMGSLTIEEDGEVMSSEPYTSIESFPFDGADVTTNDNSELSAESLGGIELDMNDESIVSLFNDSDPLSGNTRVALSSMPSPCLVLGGISPTNALTMYTGNITTTPGATITFGEHNPFGTVIKAANIPEPSTMFSAIFALGIIGAFRRRA